MESVCHEPAACAKANRPRKSRGGWRRLAYRAARRVIGLQLNQVWVRDLRSVDPVRWDDRYEFRELTSEEVRRLAADPANDLRSDLALRVADGSYRCFAAWDGPNLACYVWCAERTVDLSDSVGIPMSLPSEACYFFKAFALPAYRGRWIYILVARRVLLELHRLGKARGIALIEYDNRASMRIHEHIGLSPQGWVVTLGRGSLVCRWYTAAARQCGFGKRRPDVSPSPAI